MDRKSNIFNEKYLLDQQQYLSAPKKDTEK